MDMFRKLKISSSSRKGSQSDAAEQPDGPDPYGLKLIAEATECTVEYEMMRPRVRTRSAH